MTIAKDFASKFSVALVAVAMLFWAVGPAFAAEQTPEELQKTINDLLAQVAALQANVAGQTPATAVSCSTFTRDLKMGITGADVKELQKLLNSDADTRVAATGAGSVGMETMYFGPATMAAVSKMQVKYRAEILTPAGLVNPTGFFGPSTRAQANKLCMNAPGGDDSDDSDDDSSDDDSDDSDDDSDGDLSGEGSLDMFEIDDASDDTIEEGQEDAEIAELSIEAQDGDIQITRMDIALETTGSDDPWEVFDTVSLWVDGEMVAEMDASDEDEYLDEDDGSIRFSGLDIVAMEDEELEVLIGASVQDGVDDVPADWTVQVDEVRYFDADGVSEDDDTTDQIGETASFSIEMEGEGDELSVRSSSEDPDSTTIELEDDSKSDFTKIFAFELDASDSDGDIMVNGLTVTVDATSDGSTAASSSVYISDAMLVIDGEEYDDYDLAGSNKNDEYVFDFDDEAMIDADGMVTVEFQVEFKALATEGATVQASVVDTADTGTDVDVDAESEGGEDIAVDGSATGEVHTLRTSGAILEAGDMTETLKANTDANVTDDEGVFKIEFDVTAFEDDLYIDDNAFRGTTETNTGVNYRILAAGSATTTGTAVPTLDSDAELESGRYLVEEGNTETFTLTVEFDPAITGSYKLELYSVNFNTVNADANTQQLALPIEDYQTDSLTI